MRCTPNSSAWPLRRSPGRWRRPKTTGNPCVVRRDVAARSNYQDYRPDLRVDFWFSCAYCTLTEVEAQGIAFHIDHYVPQKVDESLRDVYTNLMYSCAPCNSAKLDYYPPNQEAADAGQRFFKADEENHADHFVVTQNTVDGKTNVGRFTTEVLMLNRLLMTRVRRARRTITETESAVVSGIQALRKLPIDSLPLELRGQFLKIRAQLEANASVMVVDDDVWREIVASRLLDPDRALRNSCGRKIGQKRSRSPLPMAPRPAAHARYPS